MTQKELQKLHDSFDFEKSNECDKYEAEIKKRGGIRFITFWEDHHHESCHVEEDMIKYMKSQGFVVLDDPTCGEGGFLEDYATGWVVFAPGKNHV